MKSVPKCHLAFQPGNRALVWSRMGHCWQLALQNKNKDKLSRGLDVNGTFLLLVSKCLQNFEVPLYIGACSINRPSECLWLATWSKCAQLPVWSTNLPNCTGVHKNITHKCLYCCPWYKDNKYDYVNNLLVKTQGPLNEGVSNGGFPDLDLSFLFCPFFSGISWFARGWSGDFPDLSFSSFSAHQ